MALLVGLFLVLAAFQAGRARLEHALQRLPEPPGPRSWLLLTVDGDAAGHARRAEAVAAALFASVGVAPLAAFDADIRLPPGYELVVIGGVLDDARRRTLAAREARERALAHTRGTGLRQPLFYTSDDGCATGDAAGGVPLVAPPHARCEPLRALLQRRFAARDARSTGSARHARDR
ncbi:MAG: hypothetical protein AAF515_15710 [Pseudomonadota bacterium]